MSEAEISDKEDALFKRRRSRRMIDQIIKRQPN